MAHHASRNFAKHARGVSIFEASNKFPSGGLVRSRHQLDEGLREAWSSILFGIYRMRNARSKFSLFLKLLDSQQFRRTRRSLREFSIFWSQVRISHLIFSIHTPQLLYSSEQGSQTSRAVGERIAGEFCVFFGSSLHPPFDIFDLDTIRKHFSHHFPLPLNAHRSISLFVCLSACMLVCIFVFLFVCLLFFTCVCLPMCMSWCL